MWPYIPNPTSKMHQIDHKLGKMIAASKFSDMTSSSNVFSVAGYFLSVLVTGVNLMSASLLVLELWQFSLIENRTEICKLEISPSELCPISGDWGKLQIPNLIQMSLIKCYWMLQNASVTAFTGSESLRDTQQGEGGKISLPLPPCRLREIVSIYFRCWRKIETLFKSLNDSLLNAFLFKLTTIYYWVWLECNYVINCSSKSYNVAMVSSM